MQNQRLELKIIPGLSVGAFKLGMNLNEILKYLQLNSNIYEQVHLKYNEEFPFKNDILINLPYNGISLRVCPYKQKLKSIEIYDFQKVSQVYRNQEYSSQKTIPTFVNICKIFGPIYPGNFNLEKSQYELNYPGITFIFPIPKEFINKYKDELPFELEDGTTPVANRVYIYSGKNWTESVFPSNNESSNNFDDLYINENYELIFPKKNLTLSLGMDSQNVIGDLGSPSNIYYKHEDKMTIHSSDKEEVTQNTSQDYFYNYYHLGLDLLFDGLNNKIKKIILHHNFPGHFDFFKYNKCQYKLKLSQDQEISPNNDWTTIQSILGPPIGPPIIFKREEDINPFGSTHIYGYEHLLFEVLKNNYVATMTIF
ncbi:UPF0183-domain-containing protein [Anaeromyces robustus]|uniref:UPF0183-domain-containing protein n=1 Tax=Anaeromyces robustus TaxID=1754192 RepID=A0A1Y1XJV5_9FUNG|nr:UPF0183-domain-containing protein [Anaeromyces robustus]|eukprot:ORX86039.1 UPF0183-domain-containing protein [Anaeromyces robustus]